LILEGFLDSLRFLYNAPSEEKSDESKGSFYEELEYQNLSERKSGSARTEAD
jgi:hypothetical protein